MTNEQIKEKYGIEPIMKEMWVWDEDKKNVKVNFVLFSDFDPNFPYAILNSRNSITMYANASETNPNDKEPKVGDKGYFWDDEDFYCYDELKRIKNKGITFYQTSLDLEYLNFSHDKQPWMK